MGLAGGNGSCLPASFVLGELPGHGGSTLQRDTRRSRHEHGAIWSPTFIGYQSSPGWQKKRGRWGRFPWQGGAFPEPHRTDGRGLHLRSVVRASKVMWGALNVRHLPHYGACDGAKKLIQSMGPVPGTFPSPYSQCPNGMSLLHGCKDPFHLFPQGSHLAEVFFSMSGCLVPGPCLGSTGRESFTRLCSSLSGHPWEAGKEGSSSEQPRGECVLTGLRSPSVGQGPPGQRDLFPYLC